MQASAAQRGARSSAAPFGLPSDFLARCWRQRPLRLPGGVAAFLPTAPSRAEISGLIDGGATHQTDGSTVWFLEGLTSGPSGIEQLVTDARDWLEWHDVWCDIFLTIGRSSIGSHYDGSDNFTLQLTGNKTWFLSAPDGVHPDDRRRRVLGEPGLGAAAMPSEPEIFEVRAGDALYIPSNWIHWGFSDGDSTSVSLVINVATPVHALREQILRNLHRDPDWSSPLPIGPGSTDARTRRLRELVTRDLPQRFQDDSLCRVTDRNGERASLKGRIDVSAAAPSADLSWAEAYIGEVSLSADAPRLDEHGMAWLLRLRAHRNLRRLVSACAERYARTDSDDARRVYAAVGDGVRALSHPALDSLLNDPEFCSWLTLAERDTAMAGARSRAEDPFAEALGLIALPALMAHVSARGPLTLDAATDEDGWLTVRQAGIRLCFPDRPSRVTLRVTEHGLQRLGPPAESDAAQDALPLPVTPAGVIVTSEWTDWLARASQESVLGTSVPCTCEQVGHLDSALGQLRVAAWVLLRGHVPVIEVDQDPIPRIPGLAVLDASAPDHWSRHLAAAHARDEFELVAQAFRLFDEGESAPARRKTAEKVLRRRYIRARLQHACGLREELDEGPDHDVFEQEAARLTRWGRAVLARITEG